MSVIVTDRTAPDDEPPLAMATSPLWWLPSFLWRSLSAKVVAREMPLLNIRELRTEALSGASASSGGVGGVETMPESSEDEPAL